MRTSMFSLLRSVFASRFGILCRQRHSTEPALSAAEERALFLDAEALARAQRRFGLQPANWGRLLAALLLTCNLLFSAPLKANDSSETAPPEEGVTSTLVEMLIDAVLSLLGDDESGSGDPGAGQ